MRSSLLKAISLFRILPTSRLIFQLPAQISLLQSTSAFTFITHHIIRPQRSLHLINRGYTNNNNLLATQHKVTATSLASTPASTPGSIVYYEDNIMPFSYDILVEQNATTTNAIIENYSSDPDFITLSKAEGEGILQRDDEDASKLQKGIDIAKDKGVLDPNFVPEEYISIDVLGKSPEGVADEILGTVRKSEGGSVVVLCGLSGTGKGTTVATLKEKLEKEDNKQVVCWSNGNVFRSVTLLAVTWCEQQKDCDGFDPAKALTKENLASFMNMLEFGKFNGKFDTKISGLGLDLLVSEVQNTELKVPKVSKNIPTVAEVTQGEVVLFASDAIKKMGEDGIFVLLEGREQTVNYVRTPLRFTLTLSDMSLIGKRRAAQRLAAGALGEVKEGASVAEIKAALDRQLANMIKEA